MWKLSLPKVYRVMDISHKYDASKKRASNLLKGWQGRRGRAAIGRVAKQLVIGDDVRR